MKFKPKDNGSDSDHEELVKLREWADQKKITDGVNAKIRAICISSTGSFFVFCMWLGNAIYNKFEAVEAGVRAFFAALKGTQ